MYLLQPFQLVFRNAGCVAWEIGHSIVRICTSVIGPTAASHLLDDVGLGPAHFIFKFFYFCGKRSLLFPQIIVGKHRNGIGWVQHDWWCIQISGAKSALDALKDQFPIFFNIGRRNMGLDAVCPEILLQEDEFRFIGGITVGMRIIASSAVFV